MSLLRPKRDDRPAQDAEALHQLAQQKVQAALAGLSGNIQTTPTEPVQHEERDPVVLEAVERMQTHISELIADDQWGRPLTWAQVARIVIGPLADRMRDADTAGVLMEAITHPEQHDEHHADHLKRRLLPLEGGGQRYVFQAESDELHEKHAEPHPEAPADEQIVEQVHLAEERLLAALEHRYPQRQPRPHADRAVQGVGWPVH